MGGHNTVQSRVENGRDAAILRNEFECEKTTHEVAALRIDQLAKVAARLREGDEGDGVKAWKNHTQDL